VQAQTTERANRESRWPWLFAVFVGIAGIILSLSLWNIRRTTESRTLAEEFRLTADNLDAMLSQEVQTFMNVLESISQLHNLSDQISEKDFNEFVTKGMVYPKQILRGFGFSQQMDDYTRAVLETGDGTNDLQTFSIVERADRSSFRPAGRKDIYFPLTYQFPADALGVPDGFDFSAAADSSNAIVRMAATGQMVFGGRVRTDNSDAYYIFAPILYSVISGVTLPAPGVLIGFSVGVFEPAGILARAKQTAADRGVRVELLPPGSAQETATLNPSTLVQERPFPIADQSWTVRCTAGPNYFAAHGGHRPTVALLIGLGLTVLLTTELLFMAGRGRRIERLIRLRTAALLEAKSMLEQEMTQRVRLESEILDVTSREKLRVGQDLHDSLGQKLTGAIFLSRALADKLAESSPDEKKEAGRINELLKEALGQVRRIARGLAPVELGDEGIANALQHLAADTQETCGARCVLRVHDDDSLPRGTTAIQLYHIAQEAVSNAARHGKPEEILITLSAGELVIENNGSGLPADAEARKGMGLKIMRYRASMIGGTLDIQPREEGGTMVICRFPLGGRESFRAG